MRTGESHIFFQFECNKLWSQTGDVYCASDFQNDLTQINQEHKT